MQEPQDDDARQYGNSLAERRIRNDGSKKRRKHTRSHERVEVDCPEVHQRQERVQGTTVRTFWKEAKQRDKDYRYTPGIQKFEAA